MKIEAAEKQRKYKPTPNSIRAAAEMLGVSTRTIWRWIGQTYTERTEKEGRIILRPRVEINESKSTENMIILRKIYNKDGKIIWHEERPTAKGWAVRKREKYYKEHPAEKRKLIRRAKRLAQLLLQSQKR